MIGINLRNKRIRVKIPATTSNLGPGFDILGLALELYNEIEVEMLSASGPDVVEIHGEGEHALPCDKTNMVVQAARKRLPRSSVKNALSFRLINRIPIARGLGSSGASRLGGVLAAHSLYHAVTGSRAWDKKDDSLLEMAYTQEGHLDNIVPALYGGLCMSSQENDRIHFASLNVPRELCGVVCVPDFELSTAQARRVLPDKISRRDAVQTASRVAFLIRAIEHRQFHCLRQAMQDVIHQPYRQKLVPGMTRVIDAAIRAGAFGAALSGAGPSIFAFSPRGSRGAIIGRAMQKAFQQVNVESRYLVLDIDRKGVSVQVIE